VIRSFGSKETERLWRRERVRSIDPRIHRVALRKLRQIGAASVLDDLRVPPGNRLEALKAIDPASTASGSTTSGGSASCGRAPDRRRWRSLTTTDRIAPIHPGEVLMEDFIEGFGITQNRLAVAIGVPPRRINEIVHGKRGISADTALRLAKYFGTSAEFWINLQSHYELDRAADLAGERIAAITPISA
jgi:addiction module HigA family antidote